jgi:hypothetical protein
MLTKSLLSALLLIFVSTGFAQDLTNPYNPYSKMEALKKKTGNNVTKMHFLVFGDSKGSGEFPGVLKMSDKLKPQFCITTADLVNRGAGKSGKKDYEKLDKQGGWFMRKYPMWPTVGNHEEAGGEDGAENVNNFFGMKAAMYSFEYGNAKFIALPWAKVKDDPKKLEWLEKELKAAKGKHIFIYKHRPHYTLGVKKYGDVEGKETATTKLYDKYEVTAVFSGHDHIYYRTKRNGVSHIISAGAGAGIYPLNREKDAIEGDVYYGKLPQVLNEKGKKVSVKDYKFHAADGTETVIKKAMYYVLSVEVDGNRVSIEMIDSESGKVWDKGIIKQ